MRTETVTISRKVEDGDSSNSKSIVLILKRDGVDVSILSGMPAGFRDWIEGRLLSETGGNEDIYKQLLSEYTYNCWKRDGKRLCRHCDRPVLYSDTVWIHAEYEKIDGRNGYWCNKDCKNTADPLEVRS